MMEYAVLYSSKAAAKVLSSHQIGTGAWLNAWLLSPKFCLIGSGLLVSTGHADGACGLY
jgi:hypothetical protein